MKKEIKKIFDNFQITPVNKHRNSLNTIQGQVYEYNEHNTDDDSLCENFIKTFQDKYSPDDGSLSESFIKKFNNNIIIFGD